MSAGGTFTSSEPGPRVAAAGRGGELGSTPPRAAPEGGTAATPPEGTVIAVEMAATVERGEALADKLAQEGARLLQAHRISNAPDPNDPKRVWIRVGGTDYDWSLAVSVEKDGSVVKALEPTKCECTKEELIDRAMQGVVDLLPTLRGEDAVAVTEPGSATKPVPDGTEPPPRRQPLGAMGKAGVALFVVGMAGAITGAVLLGIGGRESGDPQATERVSYVAPGGAVLGIGMAAVAAGSVLLGVDRGRARKRAALVPSVSPRWVGIDFRMRF